MIENLKYYVMIGLALTCVMVYVFFNIKLMVVEKERDSWKTLYSNLQSATDLQNRQILKLKQETDLKDQKIRSLERKMQVKIKQNEESEQNILVKSFSPECNMAAQEAFQLVDKIGGK